jgi:hypothetical protein
MMTMERIDCSQIMFGQALPWDLYGSTGELLLRKGHVLGARYQVQKLHTRDLYVMRPGAAGGGPSGDPSDGVAAEPAAAYAMPPPSVVRMLDEATLRLHLVLRAMLKTGGNQRQPLLAIAHLLRAACDLQPEIALASILHGRTDNYPVRHSIHTAIVALQLAQALQLAADEQMAIVQAALAMNLGMLHYHAEFDASDAKLSPKMMEMVHEHPQQSALLLRRAGVHDEACLAAVLQHHENEDGSGYPCGLPGVQICQGAKIVALADRYCAAISERRYRKVLLPPEALRDIYLGKTIAPMLLALAVRQLGVYPIGTMVRLVNGEIGVVISRGAATAAETGAAPLVASLQGPRGVPLAAPIRRDTGTPLQAIREVLSIRGADVLVAPARIWGMLAAP